MAHDPCARLTSGKRPRAIRGADPIDGIEVSDPLTQETQDGCPDAYNSNERSKNGKQTAAISHR
jgi:hypothetical protein